MTLLKGKLPLLALDYIDAEVCIFPKGHASLATSWSVPTSECALHLRFSCRPVRSGAGQNIQRPGLFPDRSGYEFDNQSHRPFQRDKRRTKGRTASIWITCCNPRSSRTMWVEEEKTREAVAEARRLFWLCLPRKLQRKRKPGPGAPKRRPSGKSASPK